ncbi:MAG TPA: alpha/beta hydrolase [Solirubrobacteraceae bacterium]
MRHATGFISGAGGPRIFWQAWRGEAEPQAVVVLVHGASEHSGRYQHVAADLTAAGYAVHALDHRGHGRSEGARAVIDRMSRAVADVDQLVLQAAEEHPGRPVFMLGHSMGGTVAVAYCLRHQDRLRGLVLSGPLAATEAAPAPLLAVGRMLSALAPRLGLVRIDAGLVSRDPQVVRDYVADPLNFHGRLPARTVAELVAAVRRFPDAVGAITIPTLILYGTEDGLAPPAGAQMLFERIGSADKRVRAYPGLFHEILNEPERDEVLAEIRAWLSERAGAPASGPEPAADDAPAGGRTSS